MKKLYALLAVFSLIGVGSIYCQYGQGYGRGYGQGGARFGWSDRCYEAGNECVLNDHINALDVSAELKTNLIELFKKVRELNPGPNKRNIREHFQKAVKFAEDGNEEKAIEEMDVVKNLLEK